jgi:hypothetical protein
MAAPDIEPQRLREMTARCWSPCAVLAIAQVVADIQAQSRALTVGAD